MKRTGRVAHLYGMSKAAKDGAPTVLVVPVRTEWCDEKRKNVGRRINRRPVRVERIGDPDHCTVSILLAVAAAW
jgi:hypothetical protein